MTTTNQEIRDWVVAHGSEYKKMYQDTVTKYPREFEDIIKKDAIFQMSLDIVTALGCTADDLDDMEAMFDTL